MPRSPAQSRKSERILRVWPRAELCDRARLEASPEARNDLHWSWDELCKQLTVGEPGWDGVRARIAVTLALARALAGPRLGRVLETRGILGALALLAGDLAVAGVSATQALQACAGLEGERGERLRELLQLLADAETLSGQPVEPARVRRASARARDAPVLAGVTRIEIVAEARWDPARIALVCALAEARPVRVRLPCDPGRARLMAALEPVFAAFERLGERAPLLDVHAADPADDADGAVERVLGALFQRRRGKEDGDGDDAGLARAATAAAQPTLVAEAEPGGAVPRRRDGEVDAPAPRQLAELGHGVEVVAAPGQRAAAREAARLARRALDQGVAPEDVLITAADFTTLELAADALERAGVAIDRPAARASESPAVALALGLGELVDQGLPCEPVLALLGSRYLPPPRTSADGLQLTTREIADIAREAGVRRLASSGDGPGRLLAHARRAPGRGRAGPSSPEAGTRHAQRVTAAASHLAWVASILEALPARATPAAHASALGRACHELGLADGARRGPPRRDDPQLADLVVATERALARDQQAWEALSDALADVRRLAPTLAESVEIGRRAFLILLVDLIDRRPAGRTGARGGRLTLARLTSAVGRPARVVIVLGVEDGRLPARARPHPLYGPADRLALDGALGPAHRLRLHRELGPDEERRAEDTLAFYRVLAAAGERAHVIYALADEGEAEATRSTLITDLMRAGARRREVARRMVPTLLDVASPGELLSRLALDLLAEPAGVLRKEPRPPLARAAALYRATQAMLGPRLERLAEIASIERGRLAFFEGRRPPGPWEGVVGPMAEVLVRLGGSAEQPLSVSALETHARCPFKLLAERVLGVRDDEAPGEDMDSRRRGSLAHACLEGTLRRLLERGVPWPWPEALQDDAPLPAALELALDEACAEAFQRAEDDGFVGHPALWGVRRTRAREDAARVLCADTRKPFGGQPVALEVSFGPSGTWPALRITDGDGAEEAFFQGKIDRVDVGAEGMVIDYKSSTQSTAKKVLLDGNRLETSFQLPLYAAVAQQALRERGLSWNGRLVSIKDAVATQTLKDVAAGRLVDELALDEAARAGARERGVVSLGDKLWQHVHALRKGEFPVSPVDCQFCPLERACRVVHLSKPEDET